VVIGLFVVFLSGILITNTLQALLNQQVQQIGILKSVGAQRRQIIGIYMMLNLLYGLLALMIALPLSFQVAFWIVDYLTVEMNTSFFGFRLIPVVILVEVAIAVFMPQRWPRCYRARASACRKRSAVSARTTPPIKAG
jgi:putative ABC transport system permease protein